MSKNSLIDVIEELLEADMTKKDQVKNPQEDETVEEALDVETGNANADEVDNKSKEVNDASTMQPSADKDSPNAEPNKNVTDKPLTDEGGSKGDNASDASAEVAADKGPHDQESDPIDTPMKDDSDPKKKVSEEEEVAEEDEAIEEADELSEKEECDEEEEEEEKAYEEVDQTEVSATVQEIADDLETTLSGEKVEEAGQDTTVQKNANDEQLPDQDKETLNTEMDDATTAEADKGDHNQESDPQETPTSANPTNAAQVNASKNEEVEVEDEAVTEETDEEVEEGYASDAQRKAVHASKADEKEEAEEVEEAKVDEDEVEELTKDQEKLPAGLQKAIKDKEAKESVEVTEAKATDVKAAAEMYMKDSSCTYEMAAEKYGCTKEEVKAACEMYNKEEAEEVSEGKPDFLDLDKDGDTKEPMAAAAKDKKEAVAEEVEEDSLDEDFKQKAAVVFETAVNEKVLTIREEIEVEFEDKLAQEKEALEEKFSEYVDYATQEWLKENALEIKYSLRTEVAENFIRGLKGLFEENYIEIPEDDISVVDELTEAVEGYKERIGEQEEMLEGLQKEVLTFKKDSIVEEISDGLTETQKIRLEKLSESVEAEEIGEFKEKLETLKEAYFESPETAAKALSTYGDEVYSMNENAEVLLNEDGSPVSQYAKYLSKTVLK